MAENTIKLFDPDHIWTEPEKNDQSLAKFHRLRTVRQEQCMSLRDIAERTNVSVQTASQEESGEIDLSLSRLFAWQSALEVPIAELLVSYKFSGDNEEQRSITKAIQLARQVVQRSDSPDVRSMTKAIVDELTQLMALLESAKSEANVKRAGS